MGRAVWRLGDGVALCEVYMYHGIQIFALTRVCVRDEIVSVEMQLVMAFWAMLPSPWIALYKVY
jgi:hypothetical protein